MNAHSKGFTLWELLITLLIAGVILGFGIPNFMEFQRNGAMVAAGNDFVSGLLLARNEAVKRQRPVGFCLSDDPTAVAPACLGNPGDRIADRNLGFVVWVDENGDLTPDGAPDLADATDGNGVINPGEPVLSQRAVTPELLRVSANCLHIVYRANGWPRDNICAGIARTVLFCDDRGNRATSGALAAPRALRVDALGRGMVQQEMVQVAQAIADLNATGVAPTCP